MPVKPENKSRYPKNWMEIRQRILQRANNRCEFCGVENHTYRYNPKTGKDAYIVLTIAHLDHTPENCSEDNLKALCQRCHNQYDAEHRKQTRKGNSAENNKAITHERNWIMGREGQGRKALPVREEAPKERHCLDRVRITRGFLSTFGWSIVPRNPMDGRKAH